MFDEPVSRTLRRAQSRGVVRNCGFGRDRLLGPNAKNKAVGFISNVTAGGAHRTNVFAVIGAVKSSS